MEDTKLKEYHYNLHELNKIFQKEKGGHNTVKKLTILLQYIAKSSYQAHNHIYEVTQIYSI